MSRPTSGTDIKIKAAGRKLLQEKGLAGLTVRGACRLAGVNTGMFAYYFGSKEVFVKIILKEVYAEFMFKLRSETSVAGDARDKLKGALVELGKFARELRKALPLLLADLAYGKREAFHFLSGNFTEHIGHLSALAQQCRPRSAVKKHSVPYMVGALVPVMVMPILMNGVMERNRVKSVGGVKLEDLLQEFFSDEGIDGRAEIALRGVGL